MDWRRGGELEERRCTSLRAGDGSDTVRTSLEPGDSRLRRGGQGLQRASMGGGEVGFGDGRQPLALHQSGKWRGRVDEVEFEGGRQPLA